MAGLLNLSLQELLAEVHRRQKVLPKLLKQKAKLQQQLTAIAAEIQALGSAGMKSGKTGMTPGVRKTRAAKTKPAAQAPTDHESKRPRNTMSLLNALLTVLQVEKAMSIPEIVAAVKKLGYRSNASNFGMIVSQVLSKAGKKVVRVKRGEYALSGWVMSRSLLT
ncbi:MAG: hypothetical protein NTV49_03905 [Kiritimatiellaeota bacterium]|nr:hypothetical protein [Kiritimatiellota bacterium]